MKRICLNPVLISSITLTLFLNACKKDASLNPVKQSEKLVYITNEGNLNKDNGSVSILEPDSNRITNYVFENENKRGTGDIIQSIGFANRKGYIIANNNDLVKIVDLSTFREIGELNIHYPDIF